MVYASESYLPCSAFTQRNCELSVHSYLAYIAFKSELL